MTERNVVILGGGGHALVIASALRAAGVSVLGFLDKDPNQQSKNLLGVPCLGDDAALEKIDPASIKLALGIGGAAKPDIRYKHFNKWKERGYHFYTVIHPTAFVDPSVDLGESVQIMAGAILQPSCCIEDNVLINTRGVIDHNCRIGAHSHIAPGAVICGHVDIEDEVFIGANSTVIQETKIGRRTRVAAGAVVMNDIGPDRLVGGIPAKKIGS